MSELTSAERVKRVLERKIPDRVPHFEWLISKKVIGAICPGCSDHNEFALQMGHDALLVSPEFSKEQVGETRWKTEWGYSVEYGNEEHGVEVDCPIKTMADFEAWTPPDVLADGRYESIKRAVRDYKGKKSIGVHLNDVFSIPRYLMGMEGLLMAIALEPELVRALVDMSVVENLKMAKVVAGLDVDFA